MRDDEDRTTGGRLFQARGAATRNDRSPKVDLLSGGTMRDVVADERRWRRPSTSAAVSCPTDALGEVGRSCAVQTAVRQNTETKPYTFRDPQPVKIAKQRRDVFGSPRREDESGSGVEDGLKSISESDTSRRELQDGVKNCMLNSLKTGQKLQKVHIKQQTTAA